MQRSLRICLLLGLTMGPLGLVADDIWHSRGGRQVEGRLAEVYGSVLLISGKQYTSFVPIDSLTDEELQRVAAFLAAKPATPSTWGTSQAKVTTALRPKLKTLRDDKLAAYDPSSQPEPDVYLFYYSAGWCGPCHRFTPDLVEAYQRLKETMPGRCEVIFVSSDQSSYEQVKYVREYSMPWPALQYSSVGNLPIVDRYAGEGIPCLVAVTREGDLIFHSYRGKEYIGPREVLKSTENLLNVMTDKSAEAFQKRHRLAIYEYVRSGATGVLPPKLYYVAFDPARYRTLEADTLELTLEIDATGLVKDAQISPELPTVLKYVFQQDLNNWLFLPAVDHGKPQARTVKMPLVIKPAKAAPADS